MHLLFFLYFFKKLKISLFFSVVISFQLFFTGDRKQLIDCAFTVAALRNSDKSMKNIQDIIRVVTTNVYSHQT